MLLKFIAISSKSYRKVQDIFPSAGTKKNKKKLTLMHETKQKKINPSRFIINIRSSYSTWINIQTLKFRQ
jgi:hypothetical protein